MEISNLKEVCTSFFYWWYNNPGSNTEQGFDSWVKKQENKILEILSELEYGYGARLKHLSKATEIDIELLRILLKKLKHEGKVEILMIWSEWTGQPDGSGYCLSDKYRREINKDKVI